MMGIVSFVHILSGHVQEVVLPYQLLQLYKIYIKSQLYRVSNHIVLMNVKERPLPLSSLFDMNLL